MPGRNSSKLFEKGLITEQQLKSLNDYEALGIFSVHQEIRLLLFLSVLLFTGGAGILIYNNIDSIGHIAILCFLFLVTVICFYFSFRYSKGFSKEKRVSEKPLYDYLVLTANLLSGIFIGYLQVQYNVFGSRYGFATLIPTLLYFFSAYYFDHKGILSLAISGIFAVVGFSTDPEVILEADFTHDAALSYSALAVCGILIAYTIYAAKAGLKEHFNMTYLNFALHIGCIVGISNLFSPFWLIYCIALVLLLWYFFYQAYKRASLNFMVFSLIYGYITFNCLLVKCIMYFEFPSDLFYLGPFYLGGSIVFLWVCLKDFKERTKHADI